MSRSKITKVTAAPTRAAPTRARAKAKAAATKPPATAAGAAESPEFWNLRLYIAGQSSKCLAAVRNLNSFCEKHLANRYKIEIIDLLENPRLARDHQILAIPTLVRKLPEPLRKVVGDLSNTERMIVGFDLKPSSERHTPVP